MDKQVEELVEYVGHWVLEGGLACICCEPDDGGSYECEETKQHGAHICDDLRSDIHKLLSHPDLYVKVKKTPLKGYEYYQYIPLAEALKDKKDG
ncbi:hypothetical protein LCGC14_1635940 [marine sediment metagenome]|uniref:Uncharacterized protein n=1 Tax=marine sediment metagenome TaxID=412755 RepID=A0A0F9KGT8_9ZZZZ